MAAHGIGFHSTSFQDMMAVDPFQGRPRSQPRSFVVDFSPHAELIIAKNL